ncbi:tRNA ligase [Thecaphora frezii]
MATATAPGDLSPGVEYEEQRARVPNSPSSAFAALSLEDDAVASTSSLAEIEAATHLVSALDAARNKPKPLIRSTGHYVRLGDQHHHLLSWKTSEFAYRKSTNVGSELPTLARGLFTERLATRDDSTRHRIAVRGYDKFFNLGEMPWTKPESIEAFTTAPYVLTFKENGCIIFIAALSPDELVVTSKHSLGALDGVETTHAQKGEEWLDVHLQRAGKTRQQLARELWRRNETAVFELCDDSFEEHVLEYSKDKSGLHLHGLNANSATFRTRPMQEVDAFAREWGFIPTRYMELGSLAKLHELTDRIGTTGTWDGEAIEGFVIRTHMPPTASDAAGSASTEAETSSAGRSDGPSKRAPVSPPYAPDQAWFYKVKFDEPYLMYRDWRELTRKMLSQKQAWENSVRARSSASSGAVEAATSPAQDQDAPPKLASADTDAAEGADGETKVSKSQLKKDRKKAERERREAEAKARAAAIEAGITPPEPPQARSKRPETILFIQWCYDRLYGSKEVKARPELFASFNEGKGIIALRNQFLDYLRTPEGQWKLAALGGGQRFEDGVVAPVEDTRPFDKTVITPIAVPGCGKTVLAVALAELFGFAHTQSDDFKGKKGFLASVEKEVEAHDVVFADKNNHLFQQRDELIELVQRLSDPERTAKAATNKKKNKNKKGGEDEAAKGVARIRTVALAWRLDGLPLNTLHRICSDRIVARGDKHQTLRADTAGAAGTREHETVLWKFLEQLQPYGSALGGEGSEGFGDAKFDETIWLSVDEGLEASLRTVIDGLCPMLGIEKPSDQRIQAALAKALEYRPAIKKENKAVKKAKDDDVAATATAIATATAGAQQQQQQEGKSGAAGAKVRYYGIAVELDLVSVLSKVFEGAVPDDAVRWSGKQFFERLRNDKRITPRPHITLVHSASVAKETEAQSQAKAQAQSALPDIKSSSGGGGGHDAEGAVARWHRYAELCQSSQQVEFSLTLDHLVWDQRVMALSVRDVASPALPDFANLQGGRGGQGQGTWRPHVTVATANPEIRPVEANRALMQAEAGTQGIYQLPIGGDAAGISATGRLQGMNH